MPERADQQPFGYTNEYIQQPFHQTIVLNFNRYIAPRNLLYEQRCEIFQ
jgi:hypothetical protein